MLEKKLLELEQQVPTAKLWIQYFSCTLTALQFVEAERLDNFKLHLQSLREMLLLFHATEHNAYAKCGHMYLQDSQKLEEKMSLHEFQMYATNGFFTIRRTDKAYSSVWSDMIIETTLNRFFGTDLRHGRSVTPSVVTRYLAAMPSTFTIMESLENYCIVRSESSKQHVDLNRSRSVKDLVDIKKFVYWLNKNKPFTKKSLEIHLLIVILQLRKVQKV